MDSNVNKILQNIVNTATLAADEAKAAVHSAGKAVAGKYDEVKMNIELARQSDEQEDVFRTHWPHAVPHAYGCR